MEADPVLRRDIIETLHLAGYQVLASDGISPALSETADLLLLDWARPGDTVQMLRLLRESRSGLPVILLVEGAESDQCLLGVRRSFSEVLQKPFALCELLARVEALLPRPLTQRASSGAVRFPTGVADLERSEVRHTTGHCCELSERASALLRYLPAN